MIFSKWQVMVSWIYYVSIYMYAMIEMSSYNLSTKNIYVYMNQNFPNHYFIIIVVVILFHIHNHHDQH